MPLDVFRRLLCSSLCLSFVHVQDETFLEYPKDIMTMEGERAEFQCVLNNPGVLIWSFGEKNDLQFLGKGGELKYERLRDLISIETFQMGEKLKIEHTDVRVSGIFTCMESMKRVDKSGKLLVFTRPQCAVLAEATLTNLGCQINSSIGISTSGKLTCNDSLVPVSENKDSIKAMSAFERDMRVVETTYSWNYADFSSCQLRLEVYHQNDYREFTSARVTWVRLNVSSGYTVTLGSSVKCSSSAGFLTNFNAKVTYDDGTIVQNHDETFQMKRLGTAEITCTATGVFGTDTMMTTAVDIRVVLKHDMTSCEAKDGLACYQRYVTLFEGGKMTREIPLGDVQALCGQIGWIENCTNYIEPCIWTRRIRGLRDSLSFVCKNVGHANLRAMLQSPQRASCLSYQFQLLPLKEAFLNLNSTSKAPVGPIEVIHQRSAKFLQDALLESCFRKDISHHFNKTTAKWMLGFRGLLFSSKLGKFDEYMDHENKLMRTEACDDTSERISTNNTCLKGAKCIRSFVGISELVHFGVVIVENATMLASEICDNPLSALQSCAYNFRSYFDDLSVLMAIDHMIVLFDGVCERDWSAFTERSSCLREHLRQTSAGYGPIQRCTHDLIEHAEGFEVLPRIFLNIENQTSLCMTVVKFLNCVHASVLSMCGKKAATLQRKYSRLSIVTNMQEMFCYSTFSY